MNKVINIIHIQIGKQVLLYLQFVNSMCSLFLNDEYRLFSPADIDRYIDCELRSGDWGGHSMTDMMPADCFLSK